jgi:hypothetical protein
MPLSSFIIADFNKRRLTVTEDASLAWSRARQPGFAVVGIGTKIDFAQIGQPAKVAEAAPEVSLIWEE